MIYIGVDPGKKGGFAIIYEDGRMVPFPMDEDMFGTYMENLHLHDGGVMCCVENVHAMPGQGVTSMFTFGRGFGFIQGVLRALCIPFELVDPKKWKKEFSITADKNTSIEVAKRLFPEENFLPTDKSRKPSDGMAEAALMAEYMRRRHGAVGNGSKSKD